MKGARERKSGEGGKTNDKYGGEGGEKRRWRKQNQVWKKEKIMNEGKNYTGR